jgi:hypothetical protein
MLWPGVIVALMGLSETFGRRTREDLEQEQLADLRQSAEAAGESLTYSMPAVTPENGLFLFDFDRVKQEMELLGFDCVEIHRGIDRDLFDAGIAPMCSLDQPTEIIVGKFDRRP